MRSIAIMTQLQMKFKLLLINHTPFVYQVIHWQTNAPAISKSPEYPDCSRTSNFETFSKLFEKFIVFFNQCLKSQRWMAMHDMPPVSWDKQMLDVWYECTCWCVYTHAGKKEIVHKEEVEKKQIAWMVLFVEWSVFAWIAVWPLLWWTVCNIFNMKLCAHTHILCMQLTACGGMHSTLNSYVWIKLENVDYFFLVQLCP